MKDFFANLFEYGGAFRGEYANELYDFVYVPVGLIWIALTLIITLAYYLFFDYPRFHRWWHWLGVMATTAVLMSIITALYTNGIFTKEGLDIAIFDYSEFLLAVFLNTTMLFFLLSLVVKNMSINRRKTPF